MTESSVKKLHVLVLSNAKHDVALMPPGLEHADVEYVDAIEDALIALRSEAFDFVIARADEFIPPQGVHFTKHAAAIMENVSQAVCIVDSTGKIDWANPKMLSFDEDVAGRVCRCCLETFAWAEREVRVEAVDLKGRRFSFQTDDNRRFEVTATPVIDLHNRVTQVAAVVWGAADTNRLQEKMEAIDRAGRELLSLDPARFSRLDAHERLSMIEQRILRCTRDLLHFDNFDIRVLEKGTNKLELVLSNGVPTNAASVELFASAERNGIAGHVAAHGRSYICPDTSKDARYISGIEGAQSSLTVPLLLQDRVVGVANFESTRLAAFTEDDRQFAEIFARYVTLALHLLQLLVSERQTTTGQFGSNVMSEITAPLNDILTDVENLVEDYIGHDDLRHRLRAISANAVNIRTIVNELTTAKPGIIGLGRKQSPQIDPDLDGKRILIADDEQVLRETVRDVLTGYGCRVSVASDGAAAIDLISNQAFDLVLSDIKMPSKNGYEVFDAAKEANSKTCVILTTGFGYDPNHSIVRARREGLTAVLFKPFKVDELLDEIRRAIRSVSD